MQRTLARGTGETTGKGYQATPLILQGQATAKDSQRGCSKVTLSLWHASELPSKLQ